MARRCTICNHPLCPSIDSWLEEKHALNPQGGWRHGDSFKEIAARANDLYQETYGKEPTGDHLISLGKIRAHVTRGHIRKPAPRQLTVEGNQLVYFTEDMRRVTLGIPALKSALTAIIALGGQNITLDPSQVTVVHLIRSVELLWRMDKSSVDRDEFMEAVLDALQKGEVETTSPLGRALEERKKAQAGMKTEAGMKTGVEG